MTKTASATPARVLHNAPHEVRIIGGQWKRSKLPVPHKPGLRPTPDRVRETLFNWLSHLAGGDLTGWRCMDVFAGTGALGLEAASRGAAAVLLTEQDAQLVSQLQTTATRLKAENVQIRKADGLQVLKTLTPASVDLVFLDPPFGAQLFEAALDRSVAALAPQGVIYLEAPTIWHDDSLARWGLQLHRHLKAGAVHAHLLKRAQT